MRLPWFVVYCVNLIRIVLYVGLDVSDIAVYQADVTLNGLISRLSIGYFALWERRAAKFTLERRVRIRSGR